MITNSRKVFDLTVFLTLMQAGVDTPGLLMTVYCVRGAYCDAPFVTSDIV